MNISVIGAGTMGSGIAQVKTQQSDVMLNFMMLKTRHWNMRRQHWKSVEPSY